MGFKSKIRNMVGFIPLYVRCFSWKRRIFVINTPTHGNLGDHLLYLATEQFLKDHWRSRRVVEVTHLQWIPKYFKHIVRKKDWVMIQPGGYLGDIWQDEEDLVREVIQTFGDRTVIVLPQTVYFSDQKAGEKSNLFYRDYKKVWFFAREKESVQQFQKFYATRQADLFPDMALYFKSHGGSLRKGLLLCLRKDKEKVVADDFLQNVMHCIRALGLPYCAADTVVDHDVSPTDRVDCVHQKLDEFRQAQVVITDRLHGMLFAAITGTPCIAMDNLSHKVSGVYEWIKDLPYLRLTAPDQISKEMIEQMIHLPPYEYDRNVLESEFERMAAQIQTICP